jgi:hypothetical protein
LGGGKDLRDAKDVATNMMMLGGYVKLSEQSVKTFQKKSAGLTGLKAKKKGTGMTGGVNQDVVYFTSAKSCDRLPTNLVTQIMVKWMRAGGIDLYRKKIQAFNTYLPFVIFYLHNGSLVQTILAEFCQLMEEGVKLLVEEVMGDEPVTLAVPPFAFRKSLPKLSGQDSSEYSGLIPWQVATRRAWHLEMATQHVSEFARVIEKCKEFAMFEDFWGSHVLISETVDYNSPPGDISRVLSTAKLHMCFHVSMTSAQLYRIVDLDKVVPYTIDEEEKESGFLCMRQVLSKHFRTCYGTSPLFAEVHQKQSGSPVEVVVPNVKEVDAMISSMNRQLPVSISTIFCRKGWIRALL